MENKHLRGLDQDLKRGIEYNKKHGGVSDTLKKLKKRPEGNHASWATISTRNGDSEAYEKGWDLIFGKKNVQGK